jgi:hypothetical protein
VYRRLAQPALLLCALVSCRIEPTPREYIDRQLPPAEVRALAEGELRDRLRVLVRALAAGDAGTARAALNPAMEVRIIGPREGEIFAGAAQAEALLELAAAAPPVSLRLQNLSVEVSARATVGWFSADVELQQRPDVDPVPLRLSGVYVLRDGDWELRQAHVSSPADLFTAPPPVARAPVEDG